MDLIELFKGTLQAENVSQNEIAINQLAKQPQFCQQLMALVDNKSIDSAIRLAAVIQLKNAIKNYWNLNKKQDFQISTNDREVIKNSILDALVRTVAEKQIRA